MTNISFGSTYKATLTPAIVTKKPDVQKRLYEYLDENKIEYKESFPQYRFKDLKDDTPILEYTIVADDSKDMDISTLCANLGINFEKRKPFDVSDVYTSVKLPPKGYSIAYVDTEKLENFIKNQNSDLEYNAETYHKYQKKDTDFALKSGDKFEVPKLFVQYLGDDGTSESLRNYVQKFGAEKMNPESVRVCMQTDDSSINTYFGLKAKGMKKVPVYMDAQSHQNAYLLGLLAK